MPRGINIWFACAIYQIGSYVITNGKYQFGEYFFCKNNARYSYYEKCVYRETVGIIPHLP